MTSESIAAPAAESEQRVDQRVRVLIVAPAPLEDPRSGGIANFIRGFIEHKPDDFDIEVVGAAVGDELPGPRWREIEFAGHAVRFMPAARLPQGRRTGLVPAKARIVAGMLRHRRRIDTRGRVAQLHAPAMGFGLLGRRQPIVRVVHNDPDDLAGSPGESLWGRLSWLLSPIERAAFRAADVFFVNQASRDAYAARMPEHAAHMHYMPIAIDTTLFHPADATERTRLRHGLAEVRSIPIDARWVLFAGRLDQQKDPLLALRAFAALTRGQDSSGTHMLVVGDGRLRTAAEELVAELGIGEQVHFFGALPRDALAVIMRAADVFMLSSEFEAGPFVVIEALASGLPVAAPRVGEVPRYVRHGETGWITSDHDPAALAEATRWALDQPRDAIAERAVNSVAGYEVRAALQPFYEAHRRIARSAAARD